MGLQFLRSQLPAVSCGSQPEEEERPDRWTSHSPVSTPEGLSREGNHKEAVLREKVVRNKQGLGGRGDRRQQHHGVYVGTSMLTLQCVIVSAWAPAATTNTSRVAKLQNECLRIITGRTGEDHPIQEMEKHANILP